MMLLGLNAGAPEDSTSLDPVMSYSYAADDGNQVGVSINHPATSLVSSSPVLRTVWMVLSTVSAALSGYHGYKRNNSVGWGLLWFGLGGLFPIVTPTIAFAQGFAKPAR